MQALLLSLSGSFFAIILVLWLFEQERKKNRYSPYTEKMLRSPGYSLNSKLQDKADDLLLPMLIICFFPFLMVYVTKDVNLETRLVTSLIFIVPCIWSVINIFKSFKEMRNLRLGLEGEVYTGQELNYLMRQGAWVYHDIPYKYGNIDHIVISKAGIFTVETKAVSKPINEKGGKDAVVKVKNEALVFPHFTTSEPIDQAKLHAKELKKYLKKKTGNDYPVFSIVALPGWYVQKLDKHKNGFLVVNPARGKGIERYMKATRIAENDLNRAVSEIEEFARTVVAKSDITDPDANNKYSFFLKRKTEEQRL